MQIVLESKLIQIIFGSRNMKTICKKSIVISIILLLIGVSVSSATTNIVKQSLIKDNQPPSKPRINGPQVRPPGTYEYTFNATDPDGDNVSYLIDWDDGTTEETDFYPSGMEITRSHTFNLINDYTIKAIAKDEHGVWGPEGTLPVIISKSKDCDCQEVSRSDFIRVERLLDRIEVYSKLLLVLSRHNPELRDLNEELSDISNLNKQWDSPFICNSLWLLAFLGGIIIDKVYDLYMKYEESNSILATFFYIVIQGIMAEFITIYIIGVKFNCWDDWGPPSP
jgi:hypothetical protein